MDATRFLEYGPLGAGVLILLVSVMLLIRMLNFAREMTEIVLQRIEDNTRALTALSERLNGWEEVP